MAYAAVASEKLAATQACQHTTADREAIICWKRTAKATVGPSRLIIVAWGGIGTDGSTIDAVNILTSAMWAGLLRRRDYKVLKVIDDEIDL